jgi:lysophospholipase L1-like esterase
MSAPSDRCSRSTDNYAQQLARKRKLQLVDVSCGGATTAHVVGPWNELPPQVDAITPDTGLVTVTIGGNDVGYIGSLIAASCASLTDGAASPICAALRARAPAGARPANAASIATPPSEETWSKVEAGLNRIAQEVRRRAPAARLVFVDYLTVVPEKELCANVPLSPHAAAMARTTAARLAALTAKVARRSRSDLVRASELSRLHDPCSPEPWMTGFIATEGSTRFTPYHPNLAGMTAVAETIDRQLAR